MVNPMGRLLLERKVKQLQEDLDAAGKYIEEHEIVHKKYRRGVPTVIEYQGRRYVLDHEDHLPEGKDDSDV